ncbi:MAG: 3-oxocholest-4-en-26-oyl-CoA dehydrogenase beta subunit [Actinomycetota bacterium]|jgi:alkylation response protein AidB-like acyl-CoA dehydrogenase
MDFSFSEEEEAARDLAAQILGDKCTHERLRELERAGTYFDRDTWTAFAQAGLLDGLGFVETCLMLEQVGRFSAPIPLLPTLVTGAALAQFGHPELVGGDRVLTSALVESPEDGVKICVPAGLDASHALVDRPDGLFLADLEGPGVERTRLNTTSGIPEARIDFRGAALTQIGGPDAVEWLMQRFTVALCAVMLGCCEQALAMTASYAGTRQQFDKPIGTFQAVGQRAADAYIDTEAIRLTMWQAAWRLREGLPSAAEVATAKFWAAEGGQRVVHAAQHIHGGIGVDRDYPLHRYFLWAKQLELSLGGATKQLRKLGALLASEPA